VTAIGDKAIAKKRSSLGRAAGGFQSRLLASLRSRRKSGTDEELASSSSRYVAFLLTPEWVADGCTTARFWKRCFDCQMSFTYTCCVSYVLPTCLL
jgi:hypothetical protein